MLSIIIPAYNEERGIGQTLDDLKSVLASQAMTYEIIVVDDASTDQTAQIVQQRGARLISHQKNCGYGAAIKTGVQKARHEIILITDADGTYPAKEIPAIVEQMKAADMVVGARVGKQVSIPLIRRPAKWFITKLANILSNAEIPDLNSGLRAMKKELFNQFIRILPDGFSLTTTITIASHANHYQVRYIPIRYLKRQGKSKIRPIQDTLNFILLIIRTILLFNPLKIFLPVSICLFFSAIFIFFYSAFFLPVVLDVTAVVLLIGSIQILATGMIADLINRRLN